MPPDSTSKCPTDWGLDMAEFGAEKEPSIAEENRGEEEGGADEGVESYPLTVIYCGGDQFYNPAVLML